MHEKKRMGLLYIRYAQRSAHPCLDLHLLETVLPNNDVGSDTVLAVVEEDNTAEEALVIIS